MKYRRYKTLHIVFTVLFLMLILASCSTPQSYPPTSPEAHTKNFIQALFENPFK